MRILPRQAERSGIGLCVLLLLIFSVTSHPVPVRDTGDYLRFMNGFLREGFGYKLIREPAYPLLLALMTKLGMTPERWIAAVQNLLFVASLYGFLRSLRGWRDSKQRSLLVALGITAIPMYAVGINGAIMTESVSASLVLAFLSCCVRMYVAIGNGESSGAMAWSAGGLATSALLSLTKGSFLYIDLAFVPLMLVVAAVFGRKWVRWKPMFVLAAILLVFGAVGRFTMSAWLGSRAGEGMWSSRAYLRGGSLMYGRVLYAQDFDFAHGTAPFLAEAMSETGCAKLVGDGCLQYRADQEEARGTAWHIYNRPDGFTDAQLMEKAEAIVLRHPIRQLAFVPYEWSRFFFHYGLGGFGRVQAPVLGRILNSGAWGAMMKVFNLALYLFIPIMLWRKRRQMAEIREAVRELPEAEVLGTIFAVAYTLALLVVHGFVPTLVRMIYPVAPLLVVVNWQGWRLFREAGKAPGMNVEDVSKRNTGAASVAISSR